MYFVRFILFCVDATNDFLGKNCQYVAGAIAFYTLFSMFPLVLALISVWGFFLGPEVQQSELAERIAEVIPVSTEFISSTMRGVASARVITGTASFLGLLWASSAAFGAVRKGINAAWGNYQNEAVHQRAPDRPRPSRRSGCCDIDPPGDSSLERDNPGDPRDHVPRQGLRQDLNGCLPGSSPLYWPSGRSSSCTGTFPTRA